MESFFKRNIFQQFLLQFNFLGAFVSLIWTTFKNIGQDVTELFRPNRFGTKTEPKFVPKIYCKRGRAAGYLWTRKWTSWQRKSSSQFCLRPMEHPYIRLQVHTLYIPTSFKSCLFWQWINCSDLLPDRCVFDDFMSILVSNAGFVS